MEIKSWIISLFKKMNPITAILVIAVVIIQSLINDIVRKSDASTLECIEQVEYLRIRVDKLEGQVDEYTRAILFKDVQIKKQADAIDSLRRKRNENN